MEQVRCGNRECDGSLTAGDLFCGVCGAPAPRPAPWPGAASEASVAANGEADERAVSPYAQVPFFEHERPRPAGPLNNATRYLCAAAYLDRGFANRVVRELIASRRAVAPSLNFDLGPVVRHCLRARKNILIRNILLVVTVLLGLILSPLPTIDFLLIAFLLGVLVPNVHWKQRGLVGRFVFGVSIAICLGIAGLFSFVIAIGTLAAAFLTTGSVVAAARQELEIVGTFVILLVLAWGVEFGYIRITFRTLIEHLQLGAPPPRPASGPEEARIAMVEGAQHGNITLYGGEDPFIGAGVQLEPEAEWSIAIKLEPENSARHILHGRPGVEGYIPIDPVELHAKIRDRLGGLNDPALPVSQRVSGLAVSDRLVGGGLLRWTSPLVDGERMMPYSHASAEAIRAMIRNPQAGVRYYQQVSVSDEGPPVLTSDGRPVLEGVDQGIAISAFVYAAVEGRMFYLQYVLTALPPIHPDYRIIDRLPSMSSGRFFGVTLMFSVKGLFSAIMHSPGGILAAFRLWLRERREEHDALSHDGSVVGDLGAMVSVRELGTAVRFGSYIRVLDVDKYNKIIERMLLETVQDFLAEKGVDIAAFESSANSVINVSGNGIQIGHGNSQTNDMRTPSPARAAARNPG